MKNTFDAQLRIADIPAAREGWIYLIHATGTNRYKIGRTVNPVARYETLKNQSPYPLQILDSFWTVDTITDEAYLHQNWLMYRVHGEWFELPSHQESLFQASKNPVYASLVKWQLLRTSERFLDNLFEAYGLVNKAMSNLLHLYDRAKSRDDLAYIDKVVYDVIPSQLFEFIDTAGDETPQFIAGFLAGACLKFTTNISNEEEGNDG